MNLRTRIRALESVVQPPVEGEVVLMSAEMLMLAHGSELR